MNILTLDCEFNKPSNKTIEIGAAAFKAKTGELIDTFHVYIDPSEQINPEITALTGITNEQVDGSTKIREAFLMLQKFHKQHKCTKNPIVWGSTTRNDSSLIYEESKLEEQNFMGFRVIDCKTLYQSLQIYRNGIIKGGLETACKTLKIEWDDKFGKPHRALADAYNTFRVWNFLMSKFYQGFKSE